MKQLTLYLQDLTNMRKKGKKENKNQEVGRKCFCNEQES